MPRRADLMAEMVTITTFAPLVMGARIAGAKPGRAGRREFRRMVDEKHAAAWEGALAAQRALLTGAMRFWTDMALAGNAFLFAAAAVPALAARPARRRVRANARRLTGF